MGAPGYMLFNLYTLLFSCGCVLMGFIDRLREDIGVLKRRRNAIILAHNYMPPEVQDIADYVGDSLELAKKALETSADVIVFAGVSFMADIAAILNPDKIVLHPEPCSRCVLADMLTKDHVMRAREEYPGAPLVLYINSPTELKVYADHIVTSSSASKLVSKLDNETILFGPDRNLADHVARETGKEVVAVPPHGNCPVHQYLLGEYHVRRALEEHPGAKLIVHPETPSSVRGMADYIGSTSQMLKAIGSIEASEYLIGTEEGLVYRARKLYPDKKIYPVNPQAICIDMKKINLLNIRCSLENLKPRVEIDPVVARRVREVMEESLRIIGG